MIDQQQLVFGRQALAEDEAEEMKAQEPPRHAIAIGGPPVALTNDDARGVDPLGELMAVASLDAAARREQRRDVAAVVLELREQLHVEPLALARQTSVPARGLRKQVSRGE